MKTQNGWPVLANNSPGSLNRQPFPGTKVVAAPGVRPGDVATVLHYVGSQFDKRVQKLVPGWCWGWASATPIPGSGAYSNHGSGTAIDLNAPNFPWKRRTMTAAQRRACMAIAKECAPVIAWGGVWGNVDEMHFEINGTAAQVKAVANKLKGGKGGIVIEESRPVFNAKYYLEVNKDVARVYNVKNAINHWKKHGIKEGRPSAPNFHVKEYLANYGDLRRAYGTNYRRAVVHYFRHGINEGRSGRKKVAVKVSDKAAELKQKIINFVKEA